MRRNPMILLALFVGMVAGTRMTAMPQTVNEFDRVLPGTIDGWTKGPASEYTPQQILEAARARITARDDAPMRRRMSNGTVISVRYCTLPDGGFVATYEDITERERAVEELQAGKRRPCCWPGCPHRRPSAEKWFEAR